MNEKKTFANFKKEDLKDYYKYMDVISRFQQKFGLKYNPKDLDRYLWQLGKWYLNPYKPTPIYFHRQEESPYPKDDNKSRFWEAEKEFITLQDIGNWKEKAKEWLKAEGEIIKLLSSKFTPEQFSLIRFIYEKYNKPSWIIEYGNGIKE